MGWTTLGRVEDRRLAQSLRDADPGALAQVYDAYAERLFDYCHALLRDQDDAGQALHDTMISAQEHIAKLREPERLRSWLYAMARNECLRRMDDPERPERRNEAPEADDAFLSVEERQRRLENRQLVMSALGGLNGRQREAIDLSVRHDLSPEELAGVLGISAQQATDLIAQARGDLDNALAAAIVARTGRQDCPSVAALTDEQDWPLEPEVCRKLVRHIESCPVCAERRKRKVSTSRLMQVLPCAALPIAIQRPLLILAAAQDQHETRTIIAQRAEPFDVWGWPTSVDRTRTTRRAHSARGTLPRLWPALAGAGAVLLIVGTVFFLMSGSPDPKPAGDSRVQAGSQPSSAAPSDSPSDAPSPTDTPTTHTPSPTPTTHTPSPTPTTHAPKPKPTHTKPKPPPVGTLSVHSSNDGNGHGTATLTARGGKVTWSASGSTYVSVSRRGGTLSAGQSVTVGLTADVSAACAASPPKTSGSASFAPGGGATITWACSDSGSG